MLHPSQWWASSWGITLLTTSHAIVSNIILELICESDNDSVTQNSKPVYGQITWKEHLEFNKIPIYYYVASTYFQV